MTALGFLGGAALLVVGAELLVRGASRLALAAGLAPLVVGLTVVAFGTSAPELAVSAAAAAGGRPEVAVGNVVGSNIFNVLLILGLSAAIAPLVVAHELVRLDVPVAIAASVLALLLALDGRIGRIEGAVLFAAMVGYTVYLLTRGGDQAGRPPSGPASAPPNGAGPGHDGAAGKRPARSWAVDLALIVGGLGLLVLGAGWLVDAAVEAATRLGVSELVVGLTVVAGGTSLPELATSVMASLRGQREIAVGNVVGSNIFNLLAVLGVGSMVAPDGLPVSRGALTFDLPIMIAVAVATLPIFFTGYVMDRWEGWLFLAYYGAYTTFLVLDAGGHPAADDLSTAVLYFVLPLTILTVGVLATRWRTRE